MEQQQISKLYSHYVNSGSVSTDTRTIQPGDLFFALQGDNFDGNQYAGKALEAGASLAIVSDGSVVADDRYFLVDDTLAALQNLATHHRRHLNIPVVALTGSNGKTTTKELIRDVLATKYKVHATPGNYNNHIGVPLTLLQITKDIEIAVIEMGANRLREIETLCRIAEPSHGMITNIGKAHIGTFGGYENILRGKTEMYQYLLETNGDVWINGVDPVLSNMAKRFDNPMVYLTKDGYYYAQLGAVDPFITVTDERGVEYHTQMIGEYNFPNIAVALAIGKTFGVDPDKAGDAIAAYVPENNRSQIIKKDGNTIILDAYNANPTSMEAAISSLSAMKAESKVVILGDMNELGDDTAEEHDRLCSMVQSINPSRVYLVGTLIEDSAKKFRLPWFKNVSDLNKELIQNPIKGSAVLVKASRSIGLEGVMEVL